MFLCGTNLCIRVLQHQQQAFTKLLRSQVQSCYARLFLNIFFLDPLLAHLQQQRQHSQLSWEPSGKHWWRSVHSLGMILPEHCWADRKHPKSHLPTRAHGRESSRGCGPSAICFWASRTHPTHAAHVRGRRFVMWVRMLTHGLISTVLRIHCLSEWWTEWKTFKNQEKEVV